MRVSISHFDQVLNFAGISFRDFVALKLFGGRKFRENGQKSQKLRNLIPLR